MPNVQASGPSFGAAMRSVLSQVSLGKGRPSYRAKSPAAQYRQLSRSAAGRKALGLAGVAPADRTARRWLGRAQAPSKANAEGIGRAYQAMQRGGIPEWVKRGEMRITGRIAAGDEDVRDRGSGGENPLLAELKNVTDTGGGKVREDGRGHWQAVEEDWQDLDDDDLEELIAEEIIAEAVAEISGGWGFPGGGYSVTISG